MLIGEFVFVPLSYRIPPPNLPVRDNLTVLPKGNTVSVRYLPQNPKISRLAGSDTDNTSRDTAITLVVIMIVVLFLLLREAVL